jgi:CAP-Gly domain
MADAEQADALVAAALGRDGRTNSGAGASSSPSSSSRPALEIQQQQPCRRRLRVLFPSRDWSHRRRGDIVVNASGQQDSDMGLLLPEDDEQEYNASISSTARWQSASVGSSVLFKPGLFKPGGRATVRWSGELPSNRSSSSIIRRFYGLETTEPHRGGSDGTFSGRKLFDCPPGTGFLVTAAELLQRQFPGEIGRTAVVPASASIQSQSLSAGDTTNGARIRGTVRRIVVNERHDFLHVLRRWPDGEDVSVPSRVCGSFQRT